MPELTQQDQNGLRTMTENDWVTACSAGDWDAAVALCTEDVDYLPADSPWLRGRSEVSDFLNEFPELVEFSQSVVKVSGDSTLAVLHATFALKFVVEGQELAGTGKVLATATKRSDAWLFSSVCFNWDAPPAPSS